MEGEPTLVIDRGSGERVELPVAGLLAHEGVIEAATRLADRSGPALPVAEILDTTLPWVTVASSDGYLACIPTDDLQEGGLLLLDDSGGPVRLMVADGDTLCWNVKHVAGLHASSDRRPDSVPDEPPH